MRILADLVQILSEEQKQQLKLRVEVSGKAEMHLVKLLLQNPLISEAEQVKQLSISAGTLNKTQTLAKDYLFDFVASQQVNPFDSIWVIQQLLHRGLLDSGKKIYKQLVKSYEDKQQWNMLEILYIEGFRIAQITGDLKWMRRVSDERRLNAEKVKEHAILYGEVLFEMLAVERFDTRSGNIAKYFERIETLYERVNKLGHHVLIHNMLNTLYMLYARYENNPDKTWGIICKVNDNRKRFSHAMNAITAAISKLNTINFLCIYYGYGNPETFRADCEKTIATGGVLAEVNFNYALLGYYLSEQNVVEAEKILKRLSTLHDATKFSLFHSIVNAVKHFGDGDYMQFRISLAEFNTHADHKDFPDMDVMLRFLELMLLKKERELQVFGSKTIALKKFMTRNLNRVRFKEEFNLLAFMSNPESARSRKIFSALQSSKYRNMRLLVRQLNSTFKKDF